MQSPVSLMLVAMSLIPLGDSAGKLLATDHGLHPFFLAFTRFGIAACLFAPFASRATWALFRDWRIWLRASLIAGGISCILTALRTEDLPTVFGAFFIGPIVSYTLSAWFLREPATWPRTLLLLIGFVGVLIIVQPSPDMSPGLLFALGAGAFYGAFLTASRWLAPLGSATGLLTTQLVIATLIMAPLGLQHVPTFTAQIIWLGLASALCSMAGNLLLILAYSRASATRLAPLVYFQLIAATICGYLVFNDIPTWTTAIGLLVLITSGFAALRLRR